MSTKLKLKQIAPPPPSESETTASLNSLSNRLDSIEANYVTTDTNQTITGNKTFSSDIILSDDASISSINPIIINDPTIERGTISSQNRYLGVYVVNDKNNNSVIQLSSQYSITNENTYSNAAFLYAYNPITTNASNIRMGIVYDQNGGRTYAPTPATDDSSNKIATTAFVNNRLPYTSGTWTPTLSGSTTAGSFTYSYTGGGRECYYVKFGNLVFLRAAFSYTITSEPAGEVRINGAPFVSDSHYDGVGGGNKRRWHLSHIGLNSSYIRPQVYKSDLSGVNTPQWGSSDSLTTWLNTVNSYDWILFSLWYKTSS